MFSTNCSLHPKKKNSHTVGQYAERKHESQNHTANPVLGIVDTLLDLADVWAFEEDAFHARSGHSLLETLQLNRVACESKKTSNR